jgi:hypothetical protein
MIATFATLQNWKKNALHNVHEIDFGELRLSTDIDIY